MATVTPSAYELMRLRDDKHDRDALKLAMEIAQRETRDVRGNYGQSFADKSNGKTARRVCRRFFVQIRCIGS